MTSAESWTSVGYRRVLFRRRDNLRPFHARGPDNKDGISFSLTFLLDIKCEHGVVLKDKCGKCAEGLDRFSRFPPRQRPFFCGRTHHRSVLFAQKTSWKAALDALHRFSAEPEKWLHGRCEPW